LRFTVKICVLVVLGVIALVGAVTAQGTSENYDRPMDALRAELERTDQLIERAGEAVRASQAPAARLSLQAAVDLQAKAWRAFDNEYPRLAQRLTMQARDKAKQAIAAGRMTEQSEHVVLNKLERVTELLERARETLADQSDGNYQTILQSATDNYNQAWEFYRSQQYRPAVMLANQAEKALLKLLRAVEGDQRGNLAYERRAEAARELLERARTLAADCGSDRASELVHQADQAYQQGRELADTGKSRAALSALQQARDLANQAIRECRGDEALANRYQRLKDEAERLAEILSPSDDQGQMYLEMTADQLKLAEEALADGRIESAAAALKAAELTLSQLKRYLDAAGG